MSQLVQQSEAKSQQRLLLCGLAVLPFVAVLVAIASAKFGIVLIFTGCLAASFGIVALFRPDWATYLFVGLIYANAPAVAVKFMGVPKLAAAGVFGLLLLPLLYYLFIQKKPLIVANAVLWIFLLVVIQFVSSVMAERMHVSIPVIITSLTEGLILYVLVTNVVRSVTVLRQCVCVLLMVGAILGSLSLFQNVTNTYGSDYQGFAQASMVERNGEKIVSPSPRAVGSVGEKNYYAQFMLFLVPLGIVIFKSVDSRNSKTIVLIATLLIMTAIGLTASRGAAVGFIILLVALFYFRLLEKKQIAILCLASLLFVATSENFRDRMLDLIGASQVVNAGGDVRAVDKSLQGRASEMMAAMIVFQRNPVVGVGAGNFPFHFSKHSDVLGFQVHGEERLAHCSYLEIAAETGMIGLIFFLAVYYVTIRDLILARRLTSCIQCRYLATGFLITILLMLVTSFFLSFAYVRYYWLILALAACAARIALEQQESEPVAILNEGATS